MNNEHNKLNIWLSENKLTINIDKSSYILRKMCEFHP